MTRLLSDLGRAVRNPLPPVYHGTTARLFHWGAVLLVIGAFATAFLDRLFPDSRDQFLALHRPIGVAILVLTVLRFAWRSQYRMPLLARPLSRVMHGVSAAVQSLLYVGLVVQPLLGWAYTNARGRDVVLPGGIALPKLVPYDRVFADVVDAWHVGFGRLLALLIGLHIAGALYHHFIRRDGLLLAMLPSRRYPRFVFDGVCRIEGVEGAHGTDCRLTDISSGGAKLEGAAGWSEGQHGVLKLSGLGVAPAFLVIAARNGVCRLGFTLDGVERGRFESALADFVNTDPRIKALVPAAKS